MAKFYGEIGFASTVETSPGVWEDVVTARKYYGDVLRNTRMQQNGESVNNDFYVGNYFSIMADGYAMQNIFAIRYIEWNGTKWAIHEVEVEAPRLLIRMGKVYNGPTPTAA